MRPLPQYISIRSTRAGLGNTTAAHCGSRSAAETQAVSLVEVSSPGVTPSLIREAWWLYAMLLTYGLLPLLHSARFNMTRLHTRNIGFDTPKNRKKVESRPSFVLEDKPSDLT